MNSYSALRIGVLILFTIALILCSCGDRTKTLSYKECSVTYKQYSGGEKEQYSGHFITNEMELESAQRNLAACLCEEYIKTKDTSLRDKIIELYNEKESYFPSSSSITTSNIDSIIKHRKELFDATMLID